MTMVINLLTNKENNHVATITGDKTVLEAAHRMNDERIGSLIVVDSKDNVEGIFTERDVLRQVVACGKDPAKTAVAEVMTPKPISCVRSTKLQECRQIMTERRIRHLPVVEAGKLVGMVTIGDLTAFELYDHKETIHHLSNYLYSEGAPTGS